MGQILECGSMSQDNFLVDSSKKEDSYLGFSPQERLCGTIYVPTMPSK